MSISSTRVIRHADAVVQFAMFLVLGLALANLLFNAAEASIGAGYPYNSFLFRPSDRFADFFKLTFSYPGQAVHKAAGFWHLEGLLAHHNADVKRFEGTWINHFHVPPLPTLIGLTFRGLVQWIDPVALFLVLVIAALGSLFTTVLGLSPPGKAGVGLATISVLSYPALLFIDRGHFFSLICGTLIVAATIRVLRDQRTDGWSVLMFAIVVNIRPNAGIIPLAVLLARQGMSIRDAGRLGLLAIAMFAICLTAAHSIYPAYSLTRFVAGLHDYGDVYAAGDIGYPGGSSFYGLLRALFGFDGWMLAPPIIVAGVLFAPAVIETRHGKLRHSEFVFLILSAYALGSHIFADYHLLVFVLPVIILAWEGVLDRSGWVVLVASSLVLAPKNFAFVIHGNVAWSWQVVANPLILLAASALTLAQLLKRDETGRTIESAPSEISFSPGLETPTT